MCVWEGGDISILSVEYEHSGLLNGKCLGLKYTQGIILGSTVSRINMSPRVDPKAEVCVHGDCSNGKQEVLMK